MKRDGVFKDDSELIQFIREHKGNFYRLAFSYVKNKENALDILQDSIHKSMISFDKLQDKKNLKSWFYKIVVNTSLDFIRKNKRIQVVDSETMEYVSSGKEDHYENVDLDRAMKQLPLDYRSIIILRFFEDLTIAEVAEVLEENPNTIKTRLYKALKLLRIEMQDEYVEEAK